MGSNRPEAIPEPAPYLRPWVCWFLILAMLTFWWVGLLTVVGWLWGVVS